MRHRIGIVLAVIMTGVLFFPGAWGYLRLLRLPAPADQLSGLPARRLPLSGPSRAPRAGRDRRHLPARRDPRRRAAHLAARRRAARPAAARLDSAVPGERPAGGRPDPAAGRSLRRGLRGHAVQRDPRRSRPGHDHPDVRTVQVASPPAGESEAIPDVQIMAEPVPVDQPTTQLTPIRVSSLASVPAAPWHEARDPGTPGASRASEDPDDWWEPITPGDPAAT